MSGYPLTIVLLFLIAVVLHFGGRAQFKGVVLVGFIAVLAVLLSINEKL